MEISYRTLGDLQRGHRVGGDTLDAVEISLGWMPGSCEAILTGGFPTLIDGQDQAVSTGVDSYGDDEWEQHIYRLLVADGQPRTVAIAAVLGARNQKLIEGL